MSIAREGTIDPAGVGDADYRRWLQQRAGQLEDRLGRMRADRRKQRGFTARQSQAFSRVKGEYSTTLELIARIDATQPAGAEHPARDLT